MRTRRKAVAAAAAVVALGGAACGSTTSGTAHHPNTGAVHAVETAYASTLGAKTADVSLVATVQSRSTSGSTETSKVTGDGQVNFTDRSFEIRVNAPSGGSIQELQAGTVQYIQVPPAAQSSVPGGKPWESVDLNKVDEAKLGRSFSQLASASSDDPTQALSNLSAVSDNVTRVGSPTVDGSPTTEYRAQVDLTKVAAQATVKAGSQAGQAVHREQQILGTNTLPVQVWVDSQNRVRQVSEQAPVPAAASGATNGSGSLGITVTFSNYGAAVSVVPPPPTQVADITAQVIQQSQGAAG